MFTWLMANLATVIISAVILAVVIAIVVGIIRKKKSGKSSCCDCSGCAMKGNCGSENQK